MDYPSCHKEGASGSTSCSDGSETTRNAGWRFCPDFLDVFGGSELQ